MDKKTLYTSSVADIIKSIANICGATKKDIEKYLENTHPFDNTWAEDINIASFFNGIGIRFDSKAELYTKIKFDTCVMSHVTSRITPPNNTDVLNTIKVLTTETDLSKYLKSYGIIFKESSKCIDVYYNSEKLDVSNDAMLRRRLRKEGNWMDNCINGFLINDNFWKDSNVVHLKSCPEIVSVVCCKIKRHDIIREWNEKTTPYALGFLVNLQDIIFDEYTKYKTIKSKVYFTYKNLIYYLVQNYHGEWNPRFNNLIIRLKDNLIVSRENVIGYYEIED